MRLLKRCFATAYFGLSADVLLFSGLVLASYAMPVLACSLLIAGTCCVVLAIGAWRELV